MAALAIPLTKWDRLIDGLIAILIFPAILAVSAAQSRATEKGRLCSSLGKISYPLFIVHYPIVRLFTLLLSGRHSRVWPSLESAPSSLHSSHSLPLA